MNSHRDNVKDAIKECFTSRKQSSGEISEIVYDIADAVFDALGITEDEQDAEGGYFMLHAKKGKRPFIALGDGAGDDTLTKRHKELLAGAKYTKGEFKGHCISDETSDGWYVYLQTPICRYGQRYHENIEQDAARHNFANYYYPIYCDDYERSQGVDEMDKE